MARRKYENNTTEALIDAEMELTKEFEQEEITEESPAEVETTTVPPTVTNGEIINAVHHVAVRMEPNFESVVLEVLRKGDKVKVLEKGNDFWKVSTSINPIAYVHSKFIKEA